MTQYQKQVLLGYEKMVNEKKQKKMPDQSPSGSINSRGAAGSSNKNTTTFKTDNEGLEGENVAEFVD
jgi:hypothetical protein